MLKQKMDEKKLVKKLDLILKKEFSTDFAFHEFSAGYGIADLVLAPNYSFLNQKIQVQPITDFNSLQFLFSFKKNRKYTLAEIKRNLVFFSEKEIKKQINKLLKSGHLECDESNFFLRTIASDGFEPIKKIIAIEAKLTDHKSGLIQARRYQYFADESYLAILKRAERNIDFEQFHKFNIGLILFDEDSNTIEIKKPKARLNDRQEKIVGLFAKQIMINRSISF